MTRTDYSDQGPREAPVLVLGGSLGTTLECWEPLLPALTQHLRVVCYDHWGHGRNDTLPQGEASVGALAQYVLQLLADLQIPHAHHAGISLGGMVAQYIAAHEPSKVQNLGLICTSARLVHRKAFAERAQKVRAEGMQAAIGTVERWCAPSYLASHPEQKSALQAMVAGLKPEGYAACCDAIAAWDGLDDLPTIQARTLVITGAEDLAIRPVHGTLIAESIPNARELQLADAAHVPVFEQPQALASALLEHFVLGG